MKIKRKDGFSTLYLVLILSALIFLILIVYEAAGGAAAASFAENVCLVSGRSVLSEFQPELFSLYGVFALRSRDGDLTDMASYYISKSCEGRGALSVALKSCELNTEKYPGLSTELFSEQIKRLGALCAAETVIDGLDIREQLRSLSEAEKSGSLIASESLKSLDGLKDYTDAVPSYEDPETGEITEGKPESEEAKATRRQASELLRRYRSATDPPALIDEDIEGKMLSAEAASSLPSFELGKAGTLSVLLSGGLLSDPAAGYLIGEYIIASCSNRLRLCDESALRCETEYILYGNRDDEKNRAAAGRAVWGIRFAADLAGILSDPEKMSELSSIAASAFSLIPLPVAVFILASTEAGISAGEELGSILDGGTVAVIPAVPDFGDYEDYLRLLLFALDEDTKLARLMDMMQLKVCGVSGKSFAFRDYAYGFELDAEFEKPVRFAKFLGLEEKRYGRIVQTHTYR